MMGQRPSGQKPLFYAFKLDDHGHQRPYGTAAESGRSMALSSDSGPSSVDLLAGVSGSR